MGDLSSSSPKHNDYVAVDIPQPVLQRLPTQVRWGNNQIYDLVLASLRPQVAEGNYQIYDPVLVSLGPYHHGQPRLKRVEDLKPEILRQLVAENGLDEQQLLKEIRSRPHETRSFYGGLSRDMFDDDVLAEMILRDAFFLIYCMKKMAAHGDDGEDDECIVLDRLGMSRLAFLVRDFFMWENQLPFFILKKLIPLTCDLDDKSVDAFFYDLVSSMINCEDYRSKNLPQLPRGKQIIHLLDACRTALVEKKKEKKKNKKKEKKKKKKEKEKEKEKEKVYNQFWSVTDLKNMRIRVRQTRDKSYCLKDISFRSHCFSGTLRLPIVLVDSKTNVIFSNLIAMEMSPGSSTDFAVTSYGKFMKSLIRKAEDVKELREQGILMSCSANDEEVVKMFRELNTEVPWRKDIFREVRERVNKHCTNKIKTMFKPKLIAVSSIVTLLLLSLVRQIFTSGFS